MLRKPVDAAKLGALLREVVAESEAGPGAARRDARSTSRARCSSSRTRARRACSRCRARPSARGSSCARAPSVSAEGGSLRETLGRMLLRHGALSEAEYTRVIERMTEKVIANEHQRMGEVLVELGLLSAEEVHQALRAQVFEKVDGLLRAARTPSWSFSELDALPEGLEPFALPPMATLVLAGLREHAAARGARRRGSRRTRRRSPGSSGRPPPCRSGSSSTARRSALLERHRRLAQPGRARARDPGRAGAARDAAPGRCDRLRERRPERARRRETARRRASGRSGRACHLRARGGRPAQGAAATGAAPAAAAPADRGAGAARGGAVLPARARAARRGEAARGREALAARGRARAR